jgi:Tol biopolymer transport system component
VLLSSGLTLAIPAVLAAQSIQRASVGPHGEDATGASFGAVISADGRWLAFSSSANDLVPGDVNSDVDLFVRDLVAGVTDFAVLDSGGHQAVGWSGSPSLSADGQWLLFTSASANLVAGDTNGCSDVFLRDRLLGVNERVTLTWDQSEPNRDCSSPYPHGLSADLRRVVFSSNAQNLVPDKTTWWGDVFVRDRVLGTTVRVSTPWNGGEADSVSYACSISGDGRCVLLSSAATNLVPGDTNGCNDVFLRDLGLGTIERVNLTYLGLEANAGAYSAWPSFDARFVFFDSDATDLVANDQNGATDVFARDRWLATTRRVSVTALGGETNGYSWSPAITPDGRFFAFTSSATNLAAGDTNAHDDVYLHDGLTGASVRVSLGGHGMQGDEFCDYATISSDARYVAFESTASNLVPGDDNRERDVFVVDRGPARIATYCAATTSGSGCTAWISARGTPSATSSAPFTIRANAIAGRVTGVLFYGATPFAPPFGPKGACVAPPLQRTLATNSYAAHPCASALEIDFNAHLQALPDPAALAGHELFCQWWCVDSKGPTGFAWSDALSFIVQP